jgi:hypothetical protein
LLVVVNEELESKDLIVQEESGLVVRDVGDVVSRINEILEDLPRGRRWG